MKPFAVKARVGLLLILLLTVSSVGIACEPTIAISIHNRTDETLQIFIDGEVLIGNARPGEKVIWEIESIYPHYTLTAEDMDGNVLYEANYTRDDFRGKETYDVYFPPLED